MSEAQPGDLQEWLAALAQTGTLIELAVLAGCALLAWLVVSLAAMTPFTKPPSWAAAV